MGGHHKGPLGRNQDFPHQLRLLSSIAPPATSPSTRSGSESSIPGFRSFHTTAPPELAWKPTWYFLPMAGPSKGMAYKACDGVFHFGELFIHGWQAAR